MVDASQQEPGQPGFVEVIDTELYKSLRLEAQLYLEKVPTFWLQKFATMGAIIGLAITQGLWTPPSDTARAVYIELIGGLMGAVVIVAMLIDAKIAEFGLHALIVSRFLRKKFSASAKLVAWEHELWSTSGLTRVRSLLTLLTMALPTFLVWLVAFLVALSFDIVTPWVRLVQVMLILAIVVYLLAGALLAPWVWRSFTAP